jgi:GNAT superfamily N-acetyltransferase
VEIRPVIENDREEIVSLYRQSQEATGIPDPSFIPPDDLGNHLFSRKAITRYVAVEFGSILGYAHIEEPNPEHIEQWSKETNNPSLIELGGAFVDPERTGKGIWKALLIHRLHIVSKELNAQAVSCTWLQNEHVKRTFIAYGGREIGQKLTPGGIICLFVFNQV